MIHHIARLSLVLALCGAFGCASTHQTPPDPNATQGIVGAIKQVDASANLFLQNPLVQAGAAPAGALLTYGALWSYSLSGGDDVEGLAAQICSWCVLANGVLGASSLTPDDVDRIGSTFDSQLNAEDAKFAPAFGPVQAQFKKVILNLSGTPDLARQTLLKFVMGVNAAASKFCK